MSLHVLDTDTLSLLQENHLKVVARVATCPPENIAVSIISVEEQLSGWYRRLGAAESRKNWRRSMSVSRGPCGRWRSCPFSPLTKPLSIARGGCKLRSSTCGKWTCALPPSRLSIRRPSLRATSG